MSQKADRLAEQDAFDRDTAEQINARPSEPVSPVGQGWAGHCAGWRVGIHERTKDDRLAGIYKCKWCSQTFDTPSDGEFEIRKQRSLEYQRPQHRSRWRG